MKNFLNWVHLYKEEAIVFIWAIFNGILPFLAMYLLLQKVIAKQTVSEEVIKILSASLTITTIISASMILLITSLLSAILSYFLKDKIFKNKRKHEISDRIVLFLALDTVITWMYGAITAPTNIFIITCLLTKCIYTGFITVLIVAISTICIGFLSCTKLTILIIRRIKSKYKKNDKK